MPFLHVPSHVTHHTHTLFSLMSAHVSVRVTCRSDVITHAQVQLKSRSHLVRCAEVYLLMLCRTLSAPPCPCSHGFLSILLMSVYVCALRARKSSDVLSLCLATGTVVVWSVGLFAFLLVTFYFRCASNAA